MATRKFVLLLKDPDVATEPFQDKLEDQGFVVTSIALTQASLSRLRSSEPDATVLWAGEPLAPALTVCRRFRSDSYLRHVPLLVVISDLQEPHIIETLKAGADVCLGAEHSSTVLTTYVESLVTLSIRRSTNGRLIALSDITIDRDRYLVERESDGRDEPIELPHKEFELLYLLASYPGKVFSRRDILSAVWGQSRVNKRTVDVHVRKIRSKIGSSYIETVKGVGYKVPASLA